jgi:hypothetical protein
VLAIISGTAAYYSYPVADILRGLILYPTELGAACFVSFYYFERNSSALASESERRLITWFSNALTFFLLVYMLYSISSERSIHAFGWAAIVVGAQAGIAMAGYVTRYGEGKGYSGHS